MNPILQVVAQSLAHLQEPDLSAYEFREMIQAIHALWTREAQQQLQRLIREQGTGVELEETQFSTGIKGPNKQYLLRQGETVLPVVIATGAPFVFFFHVES